MGPAGTRKDMICLLKPPKTIHQFRPSSNLIAFSLCQSCLWSAEQVIQMKTSWGTHINTQTPSRLFATHVMCELSPRTPTLEANTPYNTNRLRKRYFFSGNSKKTLALDSMPLLHTSVNQRSIDPRMVTEIWLYLWATLRDTSYLVRSIWVSWW